MFSTPQHHIFMIKEGWSHKELITMTEDEFLFWYEETVAFNKAKAIEEERQRKAAEAQI